MNEWTTASAPSNIALIKYMGKQEAGGNVSTNDSLSYTLDHLKTHVRVRFEAGHANALVWRPLVGHGTFEPSLSVKGQSRFLAHAERCLSALAGSNEALRLEAQKNSLIVESANGFPSDCGLASSASSFAALTLAIAELCGVETKSLQSRMRLAELSRQGSGSSCRSLFSPWALWKATGAEPIEGLPAAGRLRHLAIIVDSEKKAVSSSEAHVRVTSSLLFRGRTERAEERLRLLTDQLRRSGGEGGVHAWNRAAHIVSAESWDMHALFESSEPPFGYFIPDSIRALNCIREIASEMKTELGAQSFREPMVTMDAGPNVHVMLWKDESTAEVVSRISKRLSHIRIIDSENV